MNLKGKLTHLEAQATKQATLRLPAEEAALRRAKRDRYFEVWECLEAGLPIPHDPVDDVPLTPQTEAERVRFAKYDVLIPQYLAEYDRLEAEEQGPG